MERTNVWLDNRAAAAVKCTRGGHVCGRVRTLDRTEQDRDAAEAADLLLHFGKRSAHEQTDKTHTHTHWTLTTQTQDGFRI